MFLLYIAIVYFVLIWIVLRVTVPYMGFKKVPVSVSVPPDLDYVIDDIKNKSTNQREALQLSYDYVVGKYYGNRMKTVLNFWRAFGRYENKSAGFLPCNMQNQLLRTILVKSGFFTDSDIKIVVTPFNFFIHQYLQVRVEKEWVDVDPWSHFLGLIIGSKSSYFG